MRLGELRKRVIYEAVHEAVMQVRIKWAMAQRESPPPSWNWDAVLSNLQHAAADAAVKASTEPLRKRR